jgi:hypothetical protein
MPNFIFSAFALFLFIASIRSSPVDVVQEYDEEDKCNRSVSPSITFSIVHEFAFPSWCENLAVQENGQLLVTRLDTPEVIQVDPTGTIGPITIATWDATEYKGCLGISETVSGVFYVVASAFINADFVKTSGVNSIYKIDMNTFNATSSGDVVSNATVTKLVDCPEAGFFNGMTTLDDSNILVADIYNGVRTRSIRSIKIFILPEYFFVGARRCVNSC